MNIVIVDDDKIVCQALKTIIEADELCKVVGIGHNYEDALSLYKDHRPDLILLDIRMGEQTGLDAGKKIIAEDESAKVLFLTTFTDDEYVYESLKMGAMGYLLKQDFKSILPAIRAVLAGQNVFGKEIVDKLPDLLKSKGPEIKNADLTNREQDLVRLVAEGYNNKEMAQMLYLSEGTVRNYLTVLLEKLSLRDRTQLAIYYYKHANEESI